MLCELALEVTLWFGGDHTSEPAGNAQELFERTVEPVLEDKIDDASNPREL